MTVATVACVAPPALTSQFSDKLRDANAEFASRANEICVAVATQGATQKTSPRAPATQ
jgi:hypothetical protein